MDQKYSENINLKSLINNNDYQDNTQHIRKAKISSALRKDTEHFQRLKQTWQGTQESLVEKAQKECSFLFMNHTDLFNRMIKDELDMPIFTKILDALQSIENGAETQDSASANIGQMLADLYVNSALKRAEHLDAKNGIHTPQGPSKNISWKEYKTVNIHK